MVNNTRDAAIATPLNPQSSSRSAEKGLRTPGWLGKYPFVGLVMVLFGLSLFGVLAVSLQTHSSLIVTDTQIVDSVHGIALQSSPLVRDAMILGYYIGEHGVLLIGILLALYFLFKRFWAELSMIVIAWAGEGAIWVYLTGYFQRHRPTFDIPVWHQMTDYGFPSGHSLSAVMCFGLLAYLLVPKVRSYFWKAVIIIGAVLIMLYIGFSRLFVGDHFPIDIVAGYALGVAWSGLVYTSVELIFKRKRQSVAT